MSVYKFLFYFLCSKKHQLSQLNQVLLQLFK